MRVLLLGFAVDEEALANVLATDRGMPIQTHRFGWALVRALTSNDVHVDLVVAEPVTDYPHNSRWFIRGGSFAEAGVIGRSIPFVNVLGVKHLTRYWAARCAVGRLRNRNFDAVMVHGVNSALLWAAVKIAKSEQVPAVAVVTDAPSLRTGFDNTLTTLLKAFDSQVIRSAVNKLDGVVALTSELAKMVAPGKPAMVMEGIAVAPVAESARLMDRATLTAVYAGGLRAEYGVLDLISSVDRARGSWQLEVYGRGSAEQIVQEASKGNDRIRYGGTLSLDQMALKYASVDVLVNPRPPDQSLARESFPSKLIEYLASGVPVVTTDLPTLPPDYRAHMVIAQPGPQGLADAIDAVAGMSVAQRREMGARAREFILRTRGIKEQGERIVAFLEELQ